VRKWLSTCCGLGYLPVAPGSWGSLGAAVVYVGLWWCIVEAAGQRGVYVHIAVAVLAAAAAAAGVACGPWAIKHFASRDPKPFVIDEAAGQWLALIGLPVGSGLVAATTVAAGQFLLFRILDVVKPPPARGLERLAHGWGIVADDLAAGLYANVLGQVLFRVIWRVA